MNGDALQLLFVIGAAVFLIGLWLVLRAPTDINEGGRDAPSSRAAADEPRKPGGREAA